MARSEGGKDRKRGPAREKAEPSTPASDAKSPRKAASRATPRKKAAAPPRPAVRPATRRSDSPPKPAAPAPAPRKRTAAAKPTSRAAKPKAPEKRPTAPARKRVSRAPQVAPGVPMSEEERIGDAKYLPRDLPPRLFEEERFIFPESYGKSRIRLLVKDPDWLFAHWDVDPRSLADLRAELGERASALSRLTLRVVDPNHGGETRVLLPEGARSWYVRADTTERNYRAELGLTLPSGEFRSLAESNTVTTPRARASAQGGPRRARVDGASAPAAPADEPASSPPPAPPVAAGPGPWRPDPATTGYPGPGPSTAHGRAGEARGEGRPDDATGGASDTYRR